ncbi:MAG: hypothetical protein U0805_17235 [Pirellulales bacterium]
MAPAIWVPTGSGTSSAVMWFARWVPPCLYGSIASAAKNGKNPSVPNGERRQTRRKPQVN